MDVSIPCICPPKVERTPHATDIDTVRHPSGDTVTLKDTLGFADMQTLRYAVKVVKTSDQRASVAQILAVMSEHYIIVGVSAWSVVDEKGKPVEPTPDELRDRLMSNMDAVIAVSDAADDLYLAVMLPLLQRASTSSPPTPTSESTSPTTDSSEKPPKPSKRSSITTIPTAATEATSGSLDGASNSSQSSVSAA